jgi:GT2 family glycosyltransferase
MTTALETPRTTDTISEPAAPDFHPIRILEVEIGQALPDVPSVDPRTGRAYQTAMALVRLHTRPLGWIEVRLDGAGLSAADYADQIWAALRPVIVEHLRADGLPGVTGLDAAGLPMGETPPCVEDRARFLAHAPFVSVVIPTHERPDCLALCLRSLLGMEYPHFEIVVVDNAPKTTATFDVIEGMYSASSRVRYVREDRSGSAVARNRGLAVARGEYVAFTDDDAVVDRYWLAELIKGFDVAGNVACVTGLVLPLELETPAQVWFEQYGGFGKGLGRKLYDLDTNSSGNPMYPYNAGVLGHGNNMAVKKSEFRSIGNFDPTMGNGTPALGGVDSEALLRVIINGYTLVYEPASFVYHQHRRTYAGLHKQVYAYGVGMTALLTKTVLANPRLLFDFAHKMPAALRYTLDPGSTYHAQKASDYPRELDHLELKGLFYGPLAYLRSWWWWHVSLPLNRRWRVK